MMNPELEPLSRMLANHDWHFEFSDDYSAWTRGQRERAAIQSEKYRLHTNGLATQEEIEALVEQYRPKNL